MEQLKIKIKKIVKYCPIKIKYALKLEPSGRSREVNKFPPKVCVFESNEAGKQLETIHRKLHMPNNCVDTCISF